MHINNTPAMAAVMTMAGIVIIVVGVTIRGQTYRRSVALKALLASWIGVATTAAGFYWIVTMD